MKKWLISFIFLSFLFSMNSFSIEKFASVKGLIHRVVPQIESNIIIDSIASMNDKDVFEISSLNGKVVLAGSSPVAVASALNWYLKYYCHCQISQTGTNLILPNNLPRVDKKVRISTPYKYKYFLNYCTYDYTMAFWDWPKWQKELDWMAMQGINLVLTINGTEEVWQNTMKKLNFTDKEISDFICGPAYQAWWLMGNLEGWGGPVSQEWIKSRTELQKRMLVYMHGMKMEPILQGFYGMVPTSLKSKFKKADIRDTGKWCGFQRPDFLMPTDSTFNFIAQTYYKELEKLYGKANFYGGDPFHEGSELKVDLKTNGQLIQKSMQEASPGSTWVLQAWLRNPSSVMLSGLDKNKTLVIDLYTESNNAWKQNKGFMGNRWLFSVINNFGGRTSLFGKLDSLNLNLNEARNSQYSNKLEGIGWNPEGTNANPFIADYIFDLGWRTEIPTPEKWAENYSIYRYGKDSKLARSAWSKFAKSVYNIPFRSDEPQNVICARPSLNWERTAPWGLGRIQYKQEDLKSACSDLLKCAGELKNRDSYQYDAVDITHQYLMGVSESYYNNLVADFKSRNLAKFDISSKKFLELIKDLDALMGTRPEFLLGKWIQDARNMAPTEAEKKLFEQNARMLLTTWGYGQAHLELNDYAHREWSGLIGSLYYDRWKIFIDDLSSQLKGQKHIEFDYSKLEEDWTKQTNKFPTQTTGNSIEMAKKMFEKYNNQRIEN